MRADDRADAVLERRDDAAAVRVILRVGAKHHAYVEGQPHGEAADLHVPLFEHVEQADLNLRAQVGQLVHAEDAAVRAGNQAEVHHVFAREVPPLGMLDQVDLADQVGNRDVGRGQFFVIAAVTADPFDRAGVPFVATRSRAYLESGANGSSLISEPATIGTASSSSSTSIRSMRVFPWPRSPKKRTSCPERTAFTTWGITVSS